MELDIRAIKNRRREAFMWSLKELQHSGFETRQLDKFTFRINECLDIYPLEKRYYDIRTMKGGNINNKAFVDFIKGYFGIKPKEE